MKNNGYTFKKFYLWRQNKDYNFDIFDYEK